MEMTARFIVTFDEVWALLVAVCDELQRVQWEWQAADTAIGKARFGEARLVPTPRIEKERDKTQHRVGGEANSEIEMLRSEIAKLGGTTRHVSRKIGLKDALRQLVETETIKKAPLWQTLEFDELGIEKSLRALGVEIIPPHSDKHALAECDLGVTCVDAAPPETGTLLLRSSDDFASIRIARGCQSSIGASQRRGLLDFHHRHQSDLRHRIDDDDRSAWAEIIARLDSG
jgi:hypothetical protein